MHEVADSALISLVLSTIQDHKQNVVYSKFIYLQAALARDFVCVPGEEFLSFSAALKQLTQSKILEVFEDELRILDLEAVNYLGGLIKPSLAAFNIVLSVLQECGDRYVTLAQIVTLTQLKAATLWSKRIPSIRASFLSTDPIKNAFFTLEDYKILIKKAKNYEVIYQELDKVVHEFAAYLKTPSARRNRL
ncbi:unnamed protein product, partial [Mesorhabditis belari]|uniref:GPAT/DHAPAT C-terminal domain-containing protein n=1 Tax=Mesorhabditis belari TaxID=2138241 RepID=A0AAF3JBZ7_9BILA